MSQNISEILQLTILVLAQNSVTESKYSIHNTIEYYLSVKSVILQN